LLIVAVFLACLSSALCIFSISVRVAKSTPRTSTAFCTKASVRMSRWMVRSCAVNRPGHFGTQRVARGEHRRAFERHQGSRYFAVISVPAGGPRSSPCAAAPWPPHRQLRTRPGIARYSRAGTGVYRQYWALFAAAAYRLRERDRFVGLEGAPCSWPDKPRAARRPAFRHPRLEPAATVCAMETRRLIAPLASARPQTGRLRG
jgi:hypothetical protein